MAWEREDGCLGSQHKLTVAWERERWMYAISMDRHALLLFMQWVQRIHLSVTLCCNLWGHSLAPSWPKWTWERRDRPMATPLAVTMVTFAPSSSELSERVILWGQLVGGVQDLSGDLCVWKYHIFTYHRSHVLTPVFAHLSSPPAEATTSPLHLPLSLSLSPLSFT